MISDFQFSNNLLNKLFIHLKEKLAKKNHAISKVTVFTKKCYLHGQSGSHHKHTITAISFSAGYVSRMFSCF